MSNYSVINPTIIGSVSTAFTAQSPLAAADKFYNELISNKIFDGPAESFHFTMKDNNNKLHNFHVEELPNSSSKNVSYKLSATELKFSDEDSANMIKHFETEKQSVENVMTKSSGGGRGLRDDSSSDDISLSYLRKKRRDSSSSDDEDSYLSRIIRSRNYSYPNSPLSYFGYDPTIYIAKNLTLPITVPSLRFPFYFPNRPWLVMGPGGFLRGVPYI
jgi:hypothetical protein